MAYEITHDITIAGRQVRNFYNLSIDKDINRLTDSGSITLPGHHYNRQINKSGITRGDKIIIKVGYDGDNRQEFAGFVTSVSEVFDRFTIDFEDYSFLFRHIVPPFQWIAQADYDALSVEEKRSAAPSPVKLIDILTYILEHNDGFERGEFRVNGDYDDDGQNSILQTQWTTFTIGESTTAYTVLKDIMEQKLGLFHFKSVDTEGLPLRDPLTGDFQPQFRVGTFYLNQQKIASRTAKFNMGENVFSVSNLKHEWARRNSIEVIVTSQDPNTGTTLFSNTLRSDGYDLAPDAKTLRISLPGIPEGRKLADGVAIGQAEVNAIAARVLEQHTYTGLKGSFMAKLLPYCTTGYRISIDDPQHPREHVGSTAYENSFGGDYICNTINLTIDNQRGSSREVGLGIRLSDETRL